MPSERQMVTRWDDAAENHRRRYEWAARRLNQFKDEHRFEDTTYTPSEDDPAYTMMTRRSHSFADIACGCGYGTAYLTLETGSPVNGWDNSREAIRWAHKYFFNVNTKFPDFHVVKSHGTGFERSAFGVVRYDAVVMLETLEHLSLDFHALMVIRDLVVSDGLLLLSVPNQKYIPHDLSVNPFHLRHYTVESLRDLLYATGWEPTEWYHQEGSSPGESEVYPGADGLCIMVVCRKWEE